MENDDKFINKKKDQIKLLVYNNKDKTIFKSSYIGNNNYLVKWVGDLFTLETL